MQLCDIPVGKNAEIISLDFSPLLTKRMRDLGFCEGEDVECIRRAMMSSPILYYAKGAYVALRKSDAKRIGVSYE